MNLLEGEGGGRKIGTGRRDCFLSFSPRTKRELKAKRGGVLGREERGGGSLLHPFSFPFFLFSFFLFLFPFSLFSVFLRNETKRNEMKLCGSNSSFMNDLEMSPKKKNSDNLYIRNSTSFIDIIFKSSLLRLRVKRKLCPWTCKLSLSFFMSVPHLSDEKSKRGGGIIIYGVRSIYTYIYIYLQMVL